MAQGAESEPDSEPEYCPLCGLFYPSSSSFFLAQANIRGLTSCPSRRRQAHTKEVDENLTSLTTTFLSAPTCFVSPYCIPSNNANPLTCPVGHLLIRSVTLSSRTSTPTSVSVTNVPASSHPHSIIHTPKILSYFPYIPRNPPPAHCSLFGDFSHGTIPYTQQYDRPAGGRCQEPLLIMLMLILVICFR
jgi:hypothetical protein